MATVTGLTADRMLEIEAESVVDGTIIGGELILTKHDGSTIDAGSVIGPPGPEGPMGSDLDVLIERAILDVGIPNQIRAGRQLALEDFTNIGLAAPAGLWNFSNAFTDSSGNNRTLIAKGAVAYARGIEGLDNAAAQFTGANALFIDDTGVNDPFRLRAGSFGAWIRTAKQGVIQSIITKRAAAGQLGYWLRISTANVADFGFSSTGSDVIEIMGLSKICDNRWHFIVGTFDGVLQNLYVDGILEATQLQGDTGAELIFGSSGPLNVGSWGANASNPVNESNFGRTDEVFITSEILSADKIYNLYCAKIPHTLGALPSGVSLNVYPGAKGASLFPGDFPVAPLRLYNFSAGSLGNEGSDAGAGLAVVGAPISVAGVDGTKGNAYNFGGTQRFVAPDTGLPAGTATCSYGCWVKCSNGTSASLYILTWGTVNGNNDNRISVVQGNITFVNAGSAITGPFISDGNWHFVVVVQENAPVDGVKRKFYVDGRLVASSTVLNAVVLGGANKFVVASSLASASNFIGQIDTVFVCDVALGLDNINALYTKSLVDHLPSPKNAGDHIQSMSDEDLLVTFDTLDIAHKVSMKVMA
jgi:hypothetical protein